MMAKYFATSLAMEKVVSAPRVMSSCLPISTISMSSVGFESRSTMLPASRAAWVPVFIATPTSACARADAPQLILRRRLCHKIVDPGFRRDCRGGERIVSGDHDRADAHLAQLGET